MSFASFWNKRDRLAGRRAERHHSIRQTSHFAASRTPSVGDGVVVVQSNEDSCCAISFVRRLDEIRAESIEVLDRCGAPNSSGTLEQLLERLGSPYKEVIVVTSETRPAVLFEPSLRGGQLRAGSRPILGDDLSVGWVLDLRHSSEGAPRALITSLPTSRIAWWKQTLGDLGLRLEGVYPLAGTALAGIRMNEYSKPLLVLQLEKTFIAVLETVASGCRGLELYEETPTLERCAELIGEGCPEVALCGGGVDLSEFGYALVQSGRTWVSLPPVRCVGTSLPAPFAAMVGAARHAFDLAAPDAFACVPACDL